MWMACCSPASGSPPAARTEASGRMKMAPRRLSIAKKMPTIPTVTGTSRERRTAGPEVMQAISVDDVCDACEQILDRAVRGADASSGGPGDPALAPSIAAWSIVHGFARLALEGAFGGSPDDAAEAAKHLLPRMLDHLDV